MPSQHTEIPLLPWATVKNSYKLAWQYRSEYSQIAWYWVLLAVPVLLLAGWLQPASDSFACMNLEQIQLDKVAAQITPPATDTMLSWLPEISLILLCGSIAVAWHRLLLRNEKVPAGVYLRFDNVVWSYLAAALSIFFVSAVPELVLTSLPYTSSFGTSLLIAAVMISVLFVLGFLIVRLMVILPAKALGVTEITVSDVLQRTRNNFWRLTLGGMACLLPAAIFGVVALPFLVAANIWCSNPVGMHVGNALYIMISNLNYIILGLPIYLSFLSLSYQHFFERPETANS